jgi:hypothetical protein
MGIIIEGFILKEPTVQLLFFSHCVATVLYAGSHIALKWSGYNDLVDKKDGFNFT